MLFLEWRLTWQSWIYHHWINFCRATWKIINGAICFSDRLLFFAINVEIHVVNTDDLIAITQGELWRNFLDNNVASSRSKID